MLTKSFWTGALERALKTFFQTFVAVALAGVGANAVGLTAGLLDVSWLDALSVAGLAAVLSVATSLGNADFTAGKNEPALPTAPVGNMHFEIPNAVPAADPVNHPAEDDKPRHLGE